MVTACTKFCIWALILVLWFPNCGKKKNTKDRGVEPYDLEDNDSSCKSLVHKGIVRVADIKFPLPYRPKSFSLVTVPDAPDYLSPKYLNKTLPDLARVSADSLVIFTGHPGQRRAKVLELSKFGRPAKPQSASWWIKYFFQTGLEENETAMKKFEQAASKRSYKPSCQNFHQIIQLILSYIMFHFDAIQSAFVHHLVLYPLRRKKPWNLLARKMSTGSCAFC